MSANTFKFAIGSHVLLKKGRDDALTLVEIEGVSVHKSHETIYTVRECETGIGYPAAESGLSFRKKVGAK